MEKPIWWRGARNDNQRALGARVIVVGNEKGGAGKSTLAALIATSMLYRGSRVAVIDADLRQQSFSRFLANRRSWLPAAGVEAPVPLEFKLHDDPGYLAAADPEEAISRFESAIGMAMADADLVVIDTPGSDTAVSRCAHLQADLVVTPMNDSFVDFDVLGQVDPLTLRLLRPSLYTQVVQEARATRERHGRRLDWVVMRNRMAANDGRNRERLTHGLEALADEVGFRMGPPLRERVAYREMFPFGLTIADLAPGVRPGGVSSPRLAAREELRDLLIALRLISETAEEAGARMPEERGAVLHHMG
ncbi:division plane positioning ATPase MipZ [Caulobacter sp. NIBR1757]|uniref:division plane positioning ATPase MipZ n=1 Tax=Caulobacter sp. NIBR1757 TaxID=3016000 RepID=UPI0022F10E17|nr:division plane positioning ATPase MipZ [Caulobacter sp. NIBR1757]